MPLAWPRAHVHVLSASAASALLLLLLLLLATGPAVGDHHHHHHPARYGGVYAGLAPGLQGLQQGLPGLYAAGSPVAQLNPWLSACDLAQPNTAPDLQGACANAMAHRGRAHQGAHQGAAARLSGDIAEGPGPPGTPGTPPGPPSDEACPRSCAGHNASHTQCLHYFHESDADRLCSSGSLSESRLQELRLRHCCEHSVASSLTPEALAAVLASSSQCSHYLGALLELDALAARLSCEFGEILTRYDCDHPYSVTHRCTHCQESYRRWVCSSLLPHFPRPGGPRVRPCRSVCRSVEQKCPFFLPGDRAPAYPTQYAGEPTFLCLDPNIPESGEQLLKSSYGEDDCCYRHCSERGLPWLCPSDTSCLERPAEKTPPPVVCEPPPPAPTAAPGERTLPSACAASIAVPPPPRPSSGAAAAPSRYLLGLLGALVLHQLVVHAARVRPSSPARGAAAVAARAAGPGRPRPSPWPRPRLRHQHWSHRRPRHRRPRHRVSVQPGAPLLFQLLRRVLLRTNRLGKRTTATVILFRFVVT